MTKKLMALVLAVLMAVSLLPASALADDIPAATTITKLEDIANTPGNYVFDSSVKDVSFTGTITVTGDLTIELTGQTVKITPPEKTGGEESSEEGVENAAFLVNKDSHLTLKGTGTVTVASDTACGVTLVANSTALDIRGDVSLSGGTSGVKVSSGASTGVKIGIDTLGTISSKYGVAIASGASAALTVSSGTITGSEQAIFAESKLSDILASGSKLRINGAAATEEELAAAPASAMKTLVFDNGSEPELNVSGVKRTADAEAAVVFTASKAGTYYYQLDGESAPSADDLFKTEGKALVKGKNTLSLTELAEGEHTLYLAAQDAFGTASEIVTVNIPVPESTPSPSPSEEPTPTPSEEPTPTPSEEPTPTPTQEPTPTPTQTPTPTPETLSAPAHPVWDADGKTAKWDAVEGEGVTYALKLFKDGAETALENGTAAENRFTFDFTESGVYKFQVQAVKGEVKSDWSAESEELTVTITPPDTEAPVLSGTKGERTSVTGGKITFTANEVGKVYYVIGGEQPAKEAVLASQSRKELLADSNTVELTELGAAAVNVYLVAVDGADNASEVVTVTVPALLAAPTTLTWVGSKAMWNGVSGATGYTVRLLREGTVCKDAIPVADATEIDLSSYMNETGDGAYTYQVMATGTGTLSDWSAVSTASYTRDTTPPTISGGERAERTSSSEAKFSFKSSEEGTYYYMVGTKDSAAPANTTVAVDTNVHGGCTDATTTIRLSNIENNDERKVFVVVRDKSGNLSSVFTITIPAYSAAPTPTPTPAPTTAPTPTPAPASYTVTLQGGTGYTIAATGGSKSPVNAGGSFSFTVTPNNGYTRGTGFAVKANGTTLTSNNGVYTISNINANQTVSVSGIVVKQNSGGGTLPAAPAITTTTLAAATMGKEYRQQITATGGTPITWSYSGTLPDGLTLAANTGILSGTPTQEGSFRFAVKATNSTGSSTRQMTLVVAGSDYSVTKGANSEWTQGGDKGIDFSGNGKGTFTVKVDGAAVAADKYTTSADGATVTLTPKYLDTLATGSHTVTLVYADGSAKAKFTIKAQDKTIAPTVSSQPVSAEVAADGSATFSVTASGTTPLLCQWQVDKNDGSGWTDISGAVNASYTVEKVTAEQNGWKYRCVITNAAGSVESNAATLTVKEAIGDVKKNDDTKNNGSNRLGRILLITGIVVAVLALGAGLYFYFRRRNTSKYTD